jgi:hypothetical protein
MAEVVSSSSAPTKKPGAFGLTWAGEEKGAAGDEQAGRRERRREMGLEETDRWIGANATPAVLATSRRLCRRGEGRHRGRADGTQRRREKGLEDISMVRVRGKRKINK